MPLDNIAKRAAAYKPKERVTYKMVKEYIEAKYGFKVHTAYIAEVKRDLGLPMNDAPNAVEELKQPRKHLTAEKVEAIKDTLVKECKHINDCIISVEFSRKEFDELYLRNADGEAVIKRVSKSVPSDFTVEPIHLKPYVIVGS